MTTTESSGRTAVTWPPRPCGRWWRDPWRPRCRRRPCRRPVPDPSVDPPAPPVPAGRPVDVEEGVGLVVPAHRAGGGVGIGPELPPEGHVLAVADLVEAAHALEVAPPDRPEVLPPVGEVVAEVAVHRQAPPELMGPGPAAPDVVHEDLLGERPRGPLLEHG